MVTSWRCAGARPPAAGSPPGCLRGRSRAWNTSWPSAAGRVARWATLAPSWTSLSRRSRPSARRSSHLLRWTGRPPRRPPDLPAGPSAGSGWTSSSWRSTPRSTISWSWAGGPPRVDVQPVIGDRGGGAAPAGPAASSEAAKADEGSDGERRRIRFMVTLPEIAWRHDSPAAGGVSTIRAGHQVGAPPPTAGRPRRAPVARRQGEPAHAAARPPRGSGGARRWYGSGQASPPALPVRAGVDVVDGVLLVRLTGQVAVDRAGGRARPGPAPRPTGPSTAKKRRAAARVSEKPNPSVPRETNRPCSPGTYWAIWSGTARM